MLADAPETVYVLLLQALVRLPPTQNVSCRILARWELGQAAYQTAASSPTSTMGLGMLEASS